VNWKLLKAIEKAGVLLMLIGAVLWGLYRGSDKPWKDWETASVRVTAVYALIIYLKLFLDKDIGRIKLFLAFPALSLIWLATMISTSGELEINGRRLLVGSRANIMMLLWLGSSIFCILDLLLASEKNSKYRDSFKQSLRFSDFPVMVAFLVLWYYAHKIQSKPSLAQMMEPFFGGAVAFQMMLSNVVWLLTDDPIFSHKKTTFLAGLYLIK
jgi:hypothetical protein